jgi:hypothetical protein
MGIVLLLASSLSSSPFFGLLAILFLVFEVVTLALGLPYVTTYMTIILFAAPCAVYLSGSLVEEWVASSLRLRTVSLFAFVLSQYLMFESFVSGGLAQSLFFKGRAALPTKAAFTMDLLGDVFFTAALVSSALFLVVLIFEVPLRWFLEARRSTLHEILPALRLMGIVVVTLLSFQLILDCVVNAFFSEY